MEICLDLKTFWKCWNDGMVQCSSCRFCVTCSNKPYWCEIKHILSVIHYTYIGLCVFSLPISLVMIEIIYTLSYYHHQIGSMIYYPLFRVRPWNNGVCCMSLYSHKVFVDCMMWPRHQVPCLKTCWHTCAYSNMTPFGIIGQLVNNSVFIKSHPGVRCFSYLIVVIEYS